VLRDPNGGSGWFVADEGAGMLIALAALPARRCPARLSPSCCSARSTSRSPGPVSWADAQPGTLGVMLDDLLAGAIAGAVLLLIELLWPGMLV
jgi:phosphatidylglycerophosphatase A